MEFLDPKQKKSHQIKLFLGYGFMAAVVIAGTWLITSLSAGYYYDAETKQVVQNGLLFIDSHPESARVALNGEDKGETDMRLVLPEKDYDVQLSREGYRDWQHNVTVVGGTIERLMYPFMFPKTLVSEDVELFSSKPVFASQSPDRRWLVVIRAENMSNYELYDLSADTVQPKIATFEPSLLNNAAKTLRFKEVEWSSDNRHVLVRHDFEGGNEFIVIDREDTSKNVNLNKVFNRPISSVRLRDKKYDKYYFYNAGGGGELVTGALSGVKIEAVANNIAAFQPHGNDMLLAITRPVNSKGIAQVVIFDKDKQYVVRELPKSNRYLLDLTEFDGKWYIAVGASEEKKVYVYIDPLNDLKRETQRESQASVLLRLSAPIEYLSFSNNTRFIAVQAGSSFAVYDAETVRQFRFDTKLKLPKAYQAKWMDGHRMTAVSDDKLVVFEFDGANQQTLNAAYSEFQPFFDRDYKKLYTISPSAVVKNKSALLFTSMLYDPEN